jgi:hypothetical protein
LRRFVLAIAGLLVVVMALFPPWERVATTAPGVVVVRPAGYQWIFTPPEPAPPEPARSEIRWFDYESARDEGHTDDEIARFLSEAQQAHKGVYISKEDYAAYSVKANDPTSNPAAIAPFVKPRPLEENIAASSIHKNGDLLGQKGVRLDVVRLLVQLLGAVGVAFLGFALPAGGRPVLEEDTSGRRRL